MEKLQDFIAKPETQEILSQPPKQILASTFQRDPNRPIYYDRSLFYSPADGFVLYAKEVDPNEDILKVKGGDYTVNTLLREEIKERCLIVGIFLTYIDVHIVRIPYDGFLNYDKLPCLRVMNLSMRPIESEILDEMKINPNNLKYAYYNETYRDRITCPHLNQDVYMTLIGDLEVDVVAHYGAQNDYFTQADRCAIIKFGSHANLIIPFRNKKTKFTSLIPEGSDIWHVTAGVDPIVRISDV